MDVRCGDMYLLLFPPAIRSYHRQFSERVHFLRLSSKHWYDTQHQQFYLIYRRCTENPKTRSQKLSKENTFVRLNWLHRLAGRSRWFVAKITRKRRLTCANIHRCSETFLILLILPIDSRLTYDYKSPSLLRLLLSTNRTSHPYQRQSDNFYEKSHQYYCLRFDYIFYSIFVARGYVQIIENNKNPEKQQFVLILVRFEPFLYYFFIICIFNV